MKAPQLQEADVDFVALRAQGPGGQNVNKVSNAVQLRFNVHASRLPETLKARLLAFADSRISSEGVVVIKAQTARSLLQNKAEALQRLNDLLAEAAFVPKARRATKPTRASQQRRLQGKTVRAGVKAGRSKVSEH